MFFTIYHDYLLSQGVDESHIIEISLEETETAFYSAL